MLTRSICTLRAWVILLLPLAAACSSSTPTRTIAGQLQAGAYRVNNPVVIAQGANHQVYVAHVSSAGSFRVSVPTGTSYRLLLANTTHSGYRAISRIMWPGRMQWAKIGSGTRLNLGTLHPAGTAPSMSGNSQGENDDDQGEDEEDGAVICKATDETESDDDNDQGEQQGMTQDDNENEDEMEAENESSSMCGCGATQQESDDDDEMGAHPTGSVDGGCPPPPPPATPPSPGTGVVGSPCHVNGDCASGLICVMSTCQTQGPVLF